MSGWLSFDQALFRWINRDWAHPWLDGVMHSLSVNPFFVPGLVTLLVVVAWRSGRKGVILFVMIGVALVFANACVADPLKHWIARVRPYAALDDAILRVGRGNPIGSMPSAHAMNCALLAAVGGWYFRRSLWVTVPLAAAVGISRVYNGAHYPSDVLAGAVLGAASAAFVLLGVDRLWRWVGPRLAPVWAVRMPSLLHFPVEQARKHPPSVAASNGSDSGASSSAG